MKRIIFLLVIITSTIDSMPVDSTTFQYYPMDVGNKWTWYVYNNFSPGPGYETAIIISTQVINDHLYYRFKRDTYIFYGNQHYTGYNYMRIDSLNGNLYFLTINNNDSNDCLVDSLNSSLNDSTNIGCAGSGNWYRYSINTYNIFNNTYPTKMYSYSTYFEGGDNHQYGKGIGPVFEIAQYVMSTSSKTLRGCVINGILRGDTTVILGINQIGTEIPDKFELSQNYPNPFNPTTHIGFRIAEFGLVKLTIHDLLGKEVKTLVNKELQPGSYETDWDATEYPSGVYYYRLETGPYAETKKIILIK
ncbi:MAG: T9SS type A sorting domain-containing protein [Ignavibacteria bacterium]